MSSIEIALVAYAVVSALFIGVCVGCIRELYGRLESARDLSNMIDSRLSARYWEHDKKLDLVIEHLGVAIEKRPEKWVVTKKGGPEREP